MLTETTLSAAVWQQAYKIGLLERKLEEERRESKLVHGVFADALRENIQLRNDIKEYREYIRILQEESA